MLVAFLTLEESEQEEAYDHIAEARLRRQAGEEGLTAQLLRGLLMVAAQVPGAVSS